MQNHLPMEKQTSSSTHALSHDSAAPPTSPQPFRADLQLHLELMARDIMEAVADTERSASAEEASTDTCSEDSATKTCARPRPPAQRLLRVRRTICKHMAQLREQLWLESLGRVALKGEGGASQSVAVAQSQAVAQPPPSPPFPPHLPSAPARLVKSEPPPAEHARADPMVSDLLTFSDFLTWAMANPVDGDEAHEKAGGAAEEQPDAVFLPVPPAPPRPTRPAPLAPSLPVPFFLASLPPAYAPPVPPSPAGFPAPHPAARVAPTGAVETDPIVGQSVYIYSPSSSPLLPPLLVTNGSAHPPAVLETESDVSTHLAASSDALSLTFPAPPPPPLRGPFPLETPVLWRPYKTDADDGRPSFPGACPAPPPLPPPPPIDTQPRRPSCSSSWKCAAPLPIADVPPARHTPTPPRARLTCEFVLRGQVVLTLD